MGGYDSGMYAYAGGRPDTMPGNSFSHPVGFRPLPAGIPAGYTMGNDNGHYASTIYPDPPEREVFSTRFGRSSGCAYCAATRREESEHMGENTHCDCSERRHGRHRTPHHKHENSERARPYSESSSGDEEEGSNYTTTHRRIRRRADDMIHSSPARRGRLNSSGSRQRRTASRPPGLPSVKQRSFDSESSPDSSASPRRIAREGDSRHIELRHPLRGYQTRNRSHQRYQSESSEIHDLNQDPEGLRMGALHIDDRCRQESSHALARAEIAIDGSRRDRNRGRPEELREQYRASHYELSPKGVLDEDVKLLQPSHVSRDNDEARRRRDRSQSFSTQFGSPLREEFAEVFPLPSKQNSPSRMHRQEYAGNAPAGPTTRSKLHPEFPHPSGW